MLLNTPICDFGWKAPEFSLPDPSGKIFSSHELIGENGLLVAFLCNHCPYVQAIIKRLVEDANTMKSFGVNTVAIMSNDYEEYWEDNPENMKKFSQIHKMNFPYLVDKSQETGKAYNAICTPDFFGLNKQGLLQYRGRIDNIAMGRSGDRSAELLNAMRIIAETGEGPLSQTPSIGCSIKWRS